MARARAPNRHDGQILWGDWIRDQTGVHSRTDEHDQHGKTWKFAVSRTNAAQFVWKMKQSASSVTESKDGEREGLITTWKGDWPCMPQKRL